jgi:hypothetical protein
MNQGEKSTSFLPIVLIILSGGLLFVGLKMGHVGENDSSRSLSVEDADKLVNIHLHETNEAIETQKMQRSAENNFSAPRVGELVPFRAPQKNIDLDAPEDRQQQEMRETFGNNGSVSVDSSPRSVIEGQLADKQNLEEYDREYKEKYIKQFVENARLNGWKLVVDKNGLVKSAQRINPDESTTNVFQPSTASGDIQ